VSSEVTSVNNLTVTDVLRAIQNNNNNNNNSGSSSSNTTTSSTDDGTTSDVNNLSRLLLEAATASRRDIDTDELMMTSDPISDWLSQLTSSRQGQTSPASSFISSSILSLFIQQVTHPPSFLL